MIKTTCMIVGTHHRTKNIQPLLTLKATQLEMLKREITGCIHPRKLRWTDHIDHLRASISSKIHYCDNFLHISQMMLKNWSTKGIFYHYLTMAQVPGVPLQRVT